MLAERRLQIEVHLEQYQAVVQEHLHGHRHVSEHVKFPKQQYKVTARSLQNLMMLTTSWKLRSWVELNCAHIIEGKRRRRCKTRLNATYKSVYSHVWMSSTQRTRRLCWSTEKCTCRVYCRRSRHDGAATRSRKGVGVYSTLSHSPRALHQSVPCSPQQQQQQQRAGALTLSSSCLDGSVTPVGPGQNPQYTGAPKAGGGCGLLAKSTTTSPMAQPQCSNPSTASNVNMVAEQFRSTAR